ncbi:putative LRR receptor-like serine/threonine-protein kinase At4g29180 [Silene latifolia]|uniref:putative LRR receptor-like serine/threonine-protein kinase At4g29180 n=1 Tax=Silene latifolia TaxID=37657 RepID=UPI003D786D07
MSSLFFPLLLLLFSLFSPSFSIPPYSFYINCGSSTEIRSDNQQWVPDKEYISAGANRNLHLSWVLPILSTVRSFPVYGNLNKKFCYEIGPIVRSAKYMVRTTYFYGGVNGPSYKNPPVFDQIVDGTLWGRVNTTDDYARNMSSYYEGVFQAVGKSISVCVGVNEVTDSDPFISAIELVMLGDSVYNSTDFGANALTLIARSNFGYTGPMIRSPEDQFDRFWQPFGANGPITGVSNVSVSGIWNLPPAKIFDTRLTVESGPLELQWPEGPLPSSTYYIAMYFADDRASPSHREFSISINDVPYINNLNATSSGVAVFATKWPLDGLTNLKFTPAAGSDSGPLINGGEIFNILLLGKRTLVRDVIALERVKSSLANPPEDWNGDPCFPAKYSWTGITCSNNGSRIRIISINLENMGLSGSLSPHIANLTALNTIVLRRNNLSGTIPFSLGSLKLLEILDLASNQLSGTIPSSLGDLKSLRELHLEHNNLSGTVPKSLLQKPGLNFTFTPGNRLSLPPGRKL